MRAIGAHALRSGTSGGSTRPMRSLITSPALGFRGDGWDYAVLATSPGRCARIAACAAASLAAGTRKAEQET